jgi:hypothetical protein
LKTNTADDTGRTFLLIIAPLSMTKKFFIAASICITVLILSEYLLLREVYSQKRLYVILLYALALIGSISFFWGFYKKYRKTAG